MKTVEGGEYLSVVCVWVCVCLSPHLRVKLETKFKGLSYFLYRVVKLFSEVVQYVTGYGSWFTICTAAIFYCILVLIPC